MVTSFTYKPDLEKIYARSKDGNIPYVRYAFCEGKSAEGLYPPHFNSYRLHCPYSPPLSRFAPKIAENGRLFIGVKERYKFFKLLICELTSVVYTSREGKSK